VRETCRENKDMVCRGRAKKPARAQREDYAEQRELKSLTVIGTGKLVAYSLSCPGSVFFGWVLCSIKICSVRLAV